MNTQSIFDRPNQFAQDMRILKCPPDMSSISIDGYAIEPDEQHHVMVPHLMAERLKPHGCIPLTPAEVAALKADSSKAKK